MSFAALIIGTIFGILGGVGVLGWVLWFKQGSNAELGPEVDALRDELANMQEHTRAQLAEIQERLDFAERLLAAGRASQEDKSG